MRIIALFGLMFILLAAGCAPSFTAGDADVRLVFQVGEPGAVLNREELKSVRSVVERRLEAIGGASRFLVEIREPDELIVLSRELTKAQIDTVKHMVTRPGTLEFAVLANSRDHATLIAAAEAGDAAVDPSDPPQYAWIPLGSGADGQPVEIGQHGSISVRDNAKDPQARREVLVVLEPADRRLTDQFLKRAFAEVGESGAPCLGFEFDSNGGYLMRKLTAPGPAGLKRRLGVILEGRMLSAPDINAQVSERGIIEGDYTPEELSQLIACFNIGRLPAPVRFVEDQEVDSE